MKPHVFYLDSSSDNTDNRLAGYTGPGYYYNDESYGLHGPFNNHYDAEIAQNNYFRWLNSKPLNCKRCKKDFIESKLTLVIDSFCLCEDCVDIGDVVEAHPIVSAGIRRS